MTNKILLWKLKAGLYFSDLISLKIQKLIYISQFDFFFFKIQKNLSVFSDLISSKYKNWSVFFRYDFF